MGGSESKNEGSDGLIYFTEEERLKSKAIFMKISAQQQQFNREDFLVYCQHLLRRDIIENLYNWMLHVNKKQVDITYQYFTQCLAKLLRGTITERSHLVLVLSTGGKTSANGDELVKFVENILESLHQIICETPESASWQLESNKESIHRLALYILEDLIYSGPDKDKGMSAPIVPSSTSFTDIQIEDWLSKSSLFLQILQQVFDTCFNIYSDEEIRLKHRSPRLPTASHVDWSKVKSILDLPTLIYLNSTLPVNNQSEWRLLFSNRIYGDSFVQFIERILCKGPTLVIIKDKSGYIFGGYASDNWRKHSNFYGDVQCYLFQLKPYLSMFSPTGYNDHYLYFNQHVQTLPNGLGFGGQFDYFGLWIDNSFNSGHSKAGPRCTTYGSPQLSGSTEFEVDTIEVWAVGREPTRDDDDEGATAEELASRRSILDKDPGAKAMLTLIGKGPHSEGLREGDETAASPEEHTAHSVISLF